MNLLPMPRIVSGAEVLPSFGEFVRNGGYASVLVVTGPVVVQLPGVGQICSALGASGSKVHVFAKTSSDPTMELAAEAIAYARECRAELIVGIGGGSPLDLAKVVAAGVHHEGDVASLVGAEKVGARCLPLLAIPTTAGTGSEVTQYAIVTDTRDAMKKAVSSRRLVPQLVGLLPELTVGLSPLVTAATAMDALCHASEAYISKRNNPYSDALSLLALRGIFQNLPVVVREPGNGKARQELLQASLLAGLAFANSSVTAVHAFAYPLSGLFHLPHGMANSLMFPAVMEFNAQAEPERFAQMAEAVSGVHDPDDFVPAVIALRNQTVLPKTLSEAGVAREAIPHMAQLVMGVERLLSVNPRVVALDDAVRLLEQSC